MDRWVSGTTVEEKAYYALLATAFSIVFSIALGQLMAGLCLLLFWIGVIRGGIRVRVPPVMFPALLFISLAVVLSAMEGGGHGLWRRCGKLLWFVLVPVTATLVSGPGRPRQLLWAFFAGGAMLGLKDVLHYPVAAWRKPVPDFLTALIDKGSMTDGQMLMLAVVGLSFMILATRKAGEQVAWWGWGGLLLAVAGLIINFKRGSWFCALILLGVALLPRLKWRAWVAVAVCLVVFFLLPPVQSRMGQLRKEFNVEGGGRLTMWCKIAPALIAEHPRGIGYGCLTHERMKAVYRRVEPNRNHLHSNWAQVLVESGWAGLALYLAWMLTTIGEAVKLRRRITPADWRGRAVAVTGILLLAGLLLNGLVEYNFGDTEMMFIYALVMGLVAGQPKPLSQPA